LRGPAANRQIVRCAGLPDRPARSLEHRMTVRALRSTARRIQQLATEAAQLRAQLERLVAAVTPWLLELPGVGPISAAQILVSWSHAGRLRSEPPSRRWRVPTRSRPLRGRSLGSCSSC
jgi:transposase